MSVDADGASMLPATIARVIFDGFRDYRERFHEVTRDAKERFERRAWLEAQRAGRARLDLYNAATASVVDGIRRELGGGAPTPELWRMTKRSYVTRILDLPDYELYETFFNSVHRDLSEHSAIDETQMFVWSELDAPRRPPEVPIYSSHTMSEDIVGAARAMLQSYEFALPWQDLDRDVAYILRSLSEERPEIAAVSGLTVELLRAVFYRNKGAYLVGRMRYDGNVWPLIVPVLIDTDEKLYVDTLICTEDEVSVVFSFTRSYFMVDTSHPRALIDFLQSLLPSKQRSELYASIGLHKHGKTEFYRGFLTHLAHSNDELVIAPGIKGMVMTVFTLPSYQTAFKVIKDSFPAQKNTTPDEVKEKYRIVKAHDRVGRMADTQEFDHFVFPRARFSAALLEELQNVAASSVVLTPELVIVKHLYAERLMTPLNLYIETADERALREALDEYGNAIKQLAAANIFPGDMLLKNFGVTRHGRVVFYDYDEICYLTDVNFRAIPDATHEEDEIANEPWYSVGPKDVFPEEFRRFLFGRPGIKKLFVDMHGELFDPDYWRSLQQAIRQGQVMDVFPYRRKKRFARDRRHVPARVSP
jgi:isocitrate dehydrogenase kinase/phosphatase